jgi:hypothetical protein
MTDQVTAHSESEKKKEDWMNSKWRPMMGWMYMVVCMFDMIVFPILWSLLQTVTHTPITQWNPLTLQGAGLFHIAMGAVLGIEAFGRTQEKMAGANNGGATTPTTGFSSGPATPSVPAASGFANSSFSATPTTAPSTTFAPAPSWGTTPTAPAASGFGSSSGFGAPTTPGPVASSSGKLGPAQQQDPVL